MRNCGSVFQNVMLKNGHFLNGKYRMFYRGASHALFWVKIAITSPALSADSRAEGSILSKCPYFCHNVNENHAFKLPHSLWCGKLSSINFLKSFQVHIWGDHCSVPCENVMFSFSETVISVSASMCKKPARFCSVL